MATEREVDRMVVRLIGDQESYQKMLKDVEKQTKESAEYAKKQGSIISKSFGEAFKSAQGMMSSTGSASKKAGMISMGAGAAISAPISKAALTFSDYGKNIKSMVKESKEAAQRAKEMKKIILQNTEAYRELSKVVELNVEQAETFRIMSERTGISVKDLSKEIKVTSEEYRIWREEAEKLGLIIGEEAIKDANDLAESWIRVKESLKGMWAQAGSKVSKQFEEWNKLIVGVVTWTTKWIKENGELIQVAAKIASQLVLVGGVLVGIGTALSTISTFLGPLTALVISGTTAWIAWNTATGEFLRGSAIGLWKEYEDGVKSTLKTVINYGRQIMDYTDNVITGVSDAIKAGNLELAIEILWSGAKGAWIESLDELDSITGEKFSAIFQNLAAGNWKDSMEAALNEVIILWDKLILALDPVFTQIVNKSDSVWTEMVNGLDEAWVQIQNTVGMIRATFEDAASSIMTVWTFVKTFFSGLTEFISLLWSGAFGSMLEVTKVFVESQTVVLRKIIGVLSDIVKGMGAGLAAAIMLPIRTALKAVEAATGKTIDISVAQEAIAKAAISPQTSMLEDAASLMDDATGLGGGEGLDTTSARDVERTRAQGRGIRLEERQRKRTSKTEAAGVLRTTELNERQEILLGEIIELEERRTQLAARGKEEAAAKLEIEKGVLANLLDQARAEAELSEAQQARAADVEIETENLLRIQEAATLKDQEKQKFKDKYDPINRYLKDLKKLNFAFNETEKSSTVYKKALKEIEAQLARSDFKVNVQFGITGMDAVRAGTREEQELIERGIKYLEMKQRKKEALAEADRRQRQMDKEARDAQPQVAKPDTDAAFKEYEDLAKGTSLSELEMLNSGGFEGLRERFEGSKGSWEDFSTTGISFGDTEFRFPNSSVDSEEGRKFREFEDAVGIVEAQRATKKEAEAIRTASELTESKKEMSEPPDIEAEAIRTASELTESKKEIPESPDIEAAEKFVEEYDIPGKGMVPGSEMTDEDWSAMPSEPNMPQDERDALTPAAWEIEYNVPGKGIVPEPEMTDEDWQSVADQTSQSSPLQLPPQPPLQSPLIEDPLTKTGGSNDTSTQLERIAVGVEALSDVPRVELEPMEIT